jgi:hypothetical protein
MIATPTRKSPVVADELGVGYYVLLGLIRGKRIRPPAKDSSGDYVWTESDVEAARQALAARRRPTPIAANAGGGDAA